MDKKPFFSIVLPTLNRAKYLRFAIESVLNQSFGDLELIVSDNSSTDNTPEVVRQFSDPRIRYVRTPQKLPMGESWEFALREARGEYITFLGDDDAHGRIYLESLRNVIQEHAALVVSCKISDYYHEEVVEGGRRIKSNSFVSSAFTNRLAIYKSNDVIDYLFVSFGVCEGNISEPIQIPQLINTAYHNSIFEKIRGRFGRVFPSLLSGDYYLAVLVLNSVEDYYCLDSPLSFHGISNVSTTASITSREKELSLGKTQPDLTELRNPPLKILVPENFCVDALLQAKSDLRPDLDHITVDFTEYFVRTYQYLLFLQMEGNDVSSERKALLATINQQNLKVQERFKSATSLSTVKKIGLKVFYPTRLYRFLSRLRHPDSRIIADGARNNFANIAEFAYSVDTHFLNSYSTQQPLQ